MDTLSVEVLIRIKSVNVGVASWVPNDNVLADPSYLINPPKSEPSFRNKVAVPLFPVLRIIFPEVSEVVISIKSFTDTGPVISISPPIDNELPSQVKSLSPSIVPSPVQTPS